MLLQQESFYKTCIPNSSLTFCIRKVVRVLRKPSQVCF